MMESIEKLRAIARFMAKGRDLENHEDCNLLLIISDKIEREIAERYMELPVGADGVPIHLGDNLHSDETKRGFPCRGYSLTLNGNSKWWTVECCYDSYSGTSEYVSAKSCHHVKPRTVEDVLVEFYGEFAKAKYGEDSEVLSHYADELRDLMGVDR